MAEEQGQRFVPLSVRAGNREPFGETVGMPHYIQHSVEAWLDRAFDRSPFRAPDLDGMTTAIVRHMRPDPKCRSWRDLRFAMRADDSLYLDVLDMLLRIVDENEMERLEELLWEVAHEYRVDFANRRLVQRVDETAHDAYVSAITPEDHASESLRKAWALTFGRDRDSAKAWDQATNAIEVLLQPIVSPNDSAATLGKMLGALRDGAAKFEAALPAREANGASEAGLQRFIHGVSLVGYRPARHGTDRRPVNPQESRAVVFQAVTVVSWLRDGVLRRVAD